MKDKQLSDKVSLRMAIDVIDSRLLALLNERMKQVIAIGEVKRRAGEALYDAPREREILDRLSEENHGPLSKEAVVRLFERIIDESRYIERNSHDERHTSGRLDTTE